MCVDDWDNIEKQIERGEPVARRLSQSDHPRASLFQLHTYEAHARTNTHRRARTRTRTRTRTPGESKIQKRVEAMNAVQMKVDKYPKPWQMLKIAYGGSRSRSFNEAEDRFIVCMTHQVLAKSLVVCVGLD